MRARHSSTAARGLLRHVLHNLEKLKIVAKADGKKGRWITTTGQKLLDTVARQVSRLPQSAHAATAALNGPP
jgi:ribosomal protein S19E (S16A)